MLGYRWKQCFDSFEYWHVLIFVLFRKSSAVFLLILSGTFISMSKCCKNKQVVFIESFLRTVFFVILTLCCKTNAGRDIPSNPCPNTVPTEQNRVFVTFSLHGVEWQCCGCNAGYQMVKECNPTVPTSTMCEPCLFVTNIPTNQTFNPDGPHLQTWCGKSITTCPVGLKRVEGSRTQDASCKMINASDELSHTTQRPSIRITDYLRMNKTATIAMLEKKSDAQVVGIAVGVIFMVLVSVVLVFYLLKKKNRRIRKLKNELKEKSLPHQSSHPMSDGNCSANTSGFPTPYSTMPRDVTTSPETCPLTTQQNFYVRLDEIQTKLIDANEDAAASATNECLTVLLPELGKPTSSGSNTKPSLDVDTESRDSIELTCQSRPTSGKVTSVAASSESDSPTSSTDSMTGNRNKSIMKDIKLELSQEIENDDALRFLRTFDVETKDIDDVRRTCPQTAELFIRLFEVIEKRRGKRFTPEVVLRHFQKKRYDKYIEIVQRCMEETCDETEL